MSRSTHCRARPATAEDAELIVYYFGGSGGSVQANLDRWLGQMEQPDGRPSKAVAKTSSLTANGLKMTVLDVTGRYVAEISPGSPARHNKPGFRMKAAVIETRARPVLREADGPGEDRRTLGVGVRRLSQERAGAIGQVGRWGR